MRSNKSNKIDLTKEADEDLDVIHDFVCQVFSSKTAIEVIRGIKDKIDWIGKNPEACPIDPLFFDLQGRTIRFAKFKQSRILYEFKDETITIIRIVDMRQDPMNWEL